MPADDDADVPNEDSPLAQKKNQAPIIPSTWCAIKADSMATRQMQLSSNLLPRKWPPRIVVATCVDSDWGRRRQRGGNIVIRPAERLGPDEDRAPRPAHIEQAEEESRTVVCMEII